MSDQILIVDDDDIVRDVMLKKLKSCGYEVAEASNGCAGVECVMKRSFDLVITDILMPEKDGLEMLIYLKKQWPEVKTIAITAAGNELHLENAKLFGATVTLIKPFRLDELAHTVQKLLAK